MVYGIIRLINFAHGDIYMMGAFCAYTAIAYFNLPLVPSFLIGMVCAALLGVFIAKFAYTPVFNAPKINLFLCAIGTAIFLENFAMLVWGPETQSFPTMIQNEIYSFGGLKITKLQAVILLISILLVLVLTYIVKRTKIGRAMRCAIPGYGGSQINGNNTNKVIFITFALGSSLGAAAGTLVAMYYKAVYPMMGLSAGLKAFIAAVIGGIGSIPGAMFGGLIMEM